MGLEAPLGIGRLREHGPNLGANELTRAPPAPRHPTGRETARRQFGAKIQIIAEHIFRSLRPTANSGDRRLDRVSVMKGA